MSEREIYFKHLIDEIKSQHAQCPLELFIFNTISTMNLLLKEAVQAEQSLVIDNRYVFAFAGTVNADNPKKIGAVRFELVAFSGKRTSLASVLSYRGQR